MKRKLKSEYKHFPSVTLYQSDLEEILELFSDSGGKYKITDDDYEYANFEELRSKKGRIIKKLSVQGHSPALSFEVGNHGETSLYHGGDALAVPAYHQVEKVLNKARRPILFVLLNVYTVVGCYLLFFALLGVSYYLRKSDVTESLTFASLVVLVVVLVLIVLSFRNRSGGFSKIILANRHEEESFLARNKDKIWMLIIGTVLGFLVSNVPKLIDLFRW